MAAAGRIALRLSYPATPGLRVQRSPDPDRADLAIGVRACMRRVGIDPGGPLAAKLFRWATESDHASEDVDDLSDAEIEGLRREDLTLASARRRLAAELRRAGLIPGRRLQLRPVGYRVVEVGERRRVLMVIDPDEDDPTVLRGPDARERAQAIASGWADGPVVASQPVEPKRHPHVYAELGPRWTAGEFGTLRALDHAIAETLGCTARHARRVRTSWGLVDSRGGHRSH